METDIIPAHPRLSALLTIWIRPRGTIRQIVNADARKYVLVLAAIAGIMQVFAEPFTNAQGESPSSLCFIGRLAIGPFAGILGLFILGSLFRWTGSWFGGEADSLDVRAAVAWSGVPGFLANALAALLNASSQFVLIPATGGRQDAAFESVLALCVCGGLVVWLILTGWRAFLMVECVAEVHGFSAWRGLVTVITGYLVVYIPVLLIGVCLVMTVL